MSERDCPDEMAVLWQEHEERRKRDRLFAHPDCRDPAHPGCSQCREPDEAEAEAELIARYHRLMRTGLAPVNAPTLPNAGDLNGNAGPLIERGWD